MGVPPLAPGQLCGGGRCCCCLLIRFDASSSGGLAHDAVQLHGERSTARTARGAAAETGAENLDMCHGHSLPSRVL
ncbi:unnamed protein product [Merluccius merluccius]